MSITVVTLEHGSETFEADYWDVVKGRLWVGTEDVGVAEFSAGSWSYVYEDIESESVPCVWASLNDVPKNVVVVDKHGDFWKHDDNGRRLSIGDQSNWDDGARD